MFANMSKADELRAMREAKFKRSVAAKKRGRHEADVRQDVAKAVVTVKAKKLQALADETKGRLTSHPDCARCNADRAAAKERMKKVRAKK